MSPFPDWQEVTLEISVLLGCLYFSNSTITVIIIFPLSIISYFLLRSICLLTWQCNYWQVSNQSNRREIIAIFIITQRLLRFNYSGSNMRVMILLSLVLSLPWLCLTTLLLADQLNTWALAINCVGMWRVGNFAEINPLLHTQQSSPSVECIMQKTHSEKK